MSIILLPHIKTEIQYVDLICMHLLYQFENITECL